MTGYRPSRRPRCPGRAARGASLPLVQAMYQARRNAIDRMTTECTEVGGHGVVGVRLSMGSFPLGGPQFKAIGTAVRAPDAALGPRVPFTCDLSGQDFAKLFMKGWVPAGLVLGISIGSRHDDRKIARQTRWGSGNAEVAGWTELVNESRHDARSPRAAVIYQPNSRTTLKYIFARAFRAPNAYENYYTDGVSIVAPTKLLEPEHIGSHEVVFEHSPKSWLRITADGFYNNLSNLIDEVPDPASGLNHFVNIGHDEGRGAEFELEAKRESGLSAQASYTFSDALDEIQSARLANSPMHLAKLHGTIPASRRAFVGLELLYASSQTSYQATQVPSSFLTNATLSSKPLWGGWEFSASCYNAFSQRWYSPAGPGLTQPAIQQDGRTYRFKISYRLPVKEDRGKEDWNKK